jgi:hypothetical protein
MSLLQSTKVKYAVLPAVPVALVVGAVLNSKESAPAQPGLDKSVVPTEEVAQEPAGE